MAGSGQQYYRRHDDVGDVYGIANHHIDLCIRGLFIQIAGSPHYSSCSRRLLMLDCRTIQGRSLDPLQLVLAFRKPTAAHLRRRARRLCSVSSSSPHSSPAESLIIQTVAPVVRPSSLPRFQSTLTENWGNALRHLRPGRLRESESDTALRPEVIRYAPSRRGRGKR
jgi:hypothetical protein